MLPQSLGPNWNAATGTWCVMIGHDGTLLCGFDPANFTTPIPGDCACPYGQAPMNDSTA